MSFSHSSASSRSISSTMLAGIQRHDDQAGKRLVRVWCPVIYDRCRRAGISANDAEDVAQTVLIKVITRIDTFERGSFRAWIERITHNTIADYFRDKKRRPVAFGGSGSFIRKIPDPDAGPSPDSDSDGFDASKEPSQVNTDSLILQALLEVVRHDFQERTFEAFRRTAVNGEPVKQVAEELGMTPDAVRQAKCRGLKRLREEAHSVYALDPDH